MDRCVLSWLLCITGWLGGIPLASTQIQLTDQPNSYTQTSFGYDKNVLLDLCQYSGVKYVRNPDRPTCSYIACWDRKPYPMPCPPGTKVTSLFFWSTTYPCTQTDEYRKCDVTAQGDYDNNGYDVTQREAEVYPRREDHTDGAKTMESVHGVSENYYSRNQNSYAKPRTNQQKTYDPYYRSYRHGANDVTYEPLSGHHSNKQPHFRYHGGSRDNGRHYPGDVSNELLQFDVKTNNDVRQHYFGRNVNVGSRIQSLGKQSDVYRQYERPAQTPSSRREYGLTEGRTNAATTTATTPLLKTAKSSDLDKIANLETPPPFAIINNVTAPPDYDTSNMTSYELQTAATVTMVTTVAP